MLGLAPLIGDRHGLKGLAIRRTLGHSPVGTRATELWSGRGVCLRILAALLLAISLAACGAETVSPAASAVTAPTATANPWLAADQVARAIDFRRKAGLRADDAWVRQVALDPDALAGVLAYGVPLTPDELQALEARLIDIAAVRETVDEYGKAHADVWAGSTQDNATGIVTARFAAPIGSYEAALWSRVPPSARLSVIQVRWSLKSLEEVELRLQADLLSGATWFADNDMAVLGAGLDIRLNQLTIEVSSARSDVDGLLEGRYAAAGMITVDSDGTGVALLPKGDLAGKVVDQDGNPVVGATIELEPSIAGAGPKGDVGYETSRTGRFRIDDIEAIQYTVRVYTDGDAGSRNLLATASVTVAAGLTTNTTIVVK